MPDLLPGAEIAGCRIEAVAGRGGMGIVYRATQLSLGRPVAVKLIAPDRAGDPGFRERFERESRVAAAIDHPNVVPVYAAGEEGGHLYLVMRYVKGIDLQGLLARDQRLPPDRVAAIGNQVGAALDAAHAVGLVHRDVKPANVLLSGEHAYLADFGLSQVVGTDTRLTSTGQWIGTVDFMAPEQFTGEEVDARADVYALGCVLYNALTGEVPYPRGTVPATMLAHLHETPPRPSAVAHDLPAGFDRVIARALAKDPEDRYPSAGDLGRAALAAADGRPVTETERTVARGAAAPRPERSVNGHTAVTVAAPPTETRPRPEPPPRRERTAHQPQATLPLGDRPRRWLRRRAARALAVLGLGAAAAAIALWATAGDALDPQRSPARRCPTARSSRSCRTSPTPTARRTRPRSAGCSRATPSASCPARASAAAPRCSAPTAPVHRLADAQLRVARPSVSGGATGRASGRYVATYAGEPDVTGTITFGVLRDRGEPRIALISARQDPPDGS